MPKPDAYDLVLDYEGAGHHLEQVQDELKAAIARRDDLHGKMVAMLRRNGAGGVTSGGLRYHLKDGRVATEAAPVAALAAILPDEDDAETPADGDDAPLMTDASRDMTEYLSDRQRLVDARNVDDDGTLVLAGKGSHGYARLAAVDERAAVAARNGHPAV